MEENKKSAEQAALGHSNLTGWRPPCLEHSVTHAQSECGIQSDNMCLSTAARRPTDLMA